MFAPLLQSTPATASDLANLLKADPSAPGLAGGSVIRAVLSMYPDNSPVNNLKTQAPESLDLGGLVIISPQGGCSDQNKHSRVVVEQPPPSPRV